MLLSMTVGVSGAEDKGGDFKLPPEIAKLMDLQAEASEAYDILRTTFIIHPDGRESYPDDFAGTWVNAPYLHIALTSDTLEVVDRYRERLKGYEDIVVYETAMYSLNELDSIRFNVSERMRSGYSITSHYVDVKENKIVFEVEDLDEKSINASLSSAMRNNALKSTLPSDLFILKQGKPSVACYDITGGEGIGVGTVSYVNCHDNAIGDYALVRFTGSPAKTLTNKVYTTRTTTRNMTSTIDNLPVGATFQKFGSVSAEGAATVTHINVTELIFYDFAGYLTINGLTRAAMYTGLSVRHGDSGGPVYVNNSFAGILTSANDTTPGVFTFTPYINFKSMFTPKLN